MKKNFFYLFIPAIILIISSCVQNKEELLYKDTTQSRCDTTNNTFSGEVSNILKNNCYICHSGNSPLGGIKLDAYNSTVIQVNNGRLLGSIKHKSGYQKMPQGASKLTDCQIIKIENWIKNGAKNN